MRLEQALINLLGVNQQEVTLPNGNSSRNSFELALNNVSDGSVTNDRSHKGVSKVTSHNNRNTSRNDRSLNQNRDKVNNDTSRERTKSSNSESRPNAEPSDNDEKLIKDKENGKLTEDDTLKDETDKIYNPMLYANIIHSISEVINLPEINIETILEELNVTPYDLKDNENLSKFVQVAYNAETPIDLLDIPDIAQILSELNANIEEELASFENYKANNLDTSVEAQDADSSLIKDNIVNTLDMSQDSQSQYKEDNSNEAHSNFYESDNALNLGKAQGGTATIFEDVAAEGEIAFSNINASMTSKGTSLKSQPIQSLVAKDIINQIEGKIKVDIKGAVSEIKMLLKPENLGEVTLKVLTENGIVTAKFLADNQKVKEIIEANLNVLKESLSQQGIDVSELSVSVGQDDSQSQMQNFLKEQEKSKLRISKIIKDIMIEPEEEEISNNILDSYDSSVNYTV